MGRFSKGKKMNKSKKCVKMMDGDDDMSMSKSKPKAKDCSMSKPMSKMKDKDCSMSKGEKKSHPGFKAVEKKIEAKEGVSKDKAGAILAKSNRNASSGAKKANPALKKVK